MSRLARARRGRRPARSSPARRPTIDGGDARRASASAIAEMAQWVDAINATDNTGRARARLERRGRDRARSSSGVEPVLQVVCRDKNRIALPGRHRRGGAARRREHLLPDRRRRDRGRRARGAARLRPRRPAARPRRHRPLAGAATCPGRRLEPAPPLFVGAVENPAAPPLDHRARARREEDPRRRPLPAAADLLPPRPPRGVRRGARRAGADRARGAPADDRARAGRTSAVASWTRTCPASTCPAETHRAGRAGGRPGRGGVRSSRSSRRATRSRSPAFAAFT